jgi:multidrug resistance efflux pump
MISEQRIEELRELFQYAWPDGKDTVGHTGQSWAKAKADLLSLLDEVRGLRQEMVIKVGALETLSGLEEAWVKEKARAEKSEAEVRRLRMDLREEQIDYDLLDQLKEKIKAERNYWRNEQGNENQRWKQAEVELVAARERYSVAENELSCANSKNAELKAALDLVRPLLEAVEKAEFHGAAGMGLLMNEDDKKAILSAALDYQRKVKGGK